jgi:ceramide glucosyltransferase
MRRYAYDGHKSAGIGGGFFVSSYAVNLLNPIAGAVAGLSLVVAIWQWMAARRFPLHQRASGAGFAPAISILKPLKGCDDTTAESLRSWLEQNYAGKMQILFGVAEAGDPVCGIVRRLMAEHPERDAQLVVCEQLEGANAKAAKLAYLEKLAKYDFILVSDADVRVPEDLLANMVMAALGQPTSSSALTRVAGRGGTGLVCCFYRLANPTTVAMRWEAVAINADFWSQVLQSQTLKPLDFALGAVMLSPRPVLEEVGGFRALVDCLADDYQLGNRIARRGYGIVLCPVVVECWEGRMDWKEVWNHQLRWARTIRVSQPLPYFFSILSNVTFWALLWLGISAVSAKPYCASLAAAVVLLLRLALAKDLQRRFTWGRDLVSPYWLTVVKDLLQAALWVGAFLGDTIEWRGRRMKLGQDGTLIEVRSEE